MVNIDWSSVTVTHSYDTATIGAGDLVMTIDRDPSDRNTSDTYAMERGLLDYIGEKRFIHKTFEVQIFGMKSPLYIEFTPMKVMVGTSMKHNGTNAEDGKRERTNRNIFRPIRRRDPSKV